MLRIRDLLDHDLGPCLLSSKLFHRLADILLNNVVPEYDAYLLFVGKELRHAEGRGNAPLPFLIGVVDVFESKFMAIAEKPEEVSRIGAAGNNEDIHYPGI